MKNAAILFLLIVAVGVVVPLLLAGFLAGAALFFIGRLARALFPAVTIFDDILQFMVIVGGLLFMVPLALLTALYLGGEFPETYRRSRRRHNIDRDVLAVAAE